MRLDWSAFRLSFLETIIARYRRHPHPPISNLGFEISGYVRHSPFGISTGKHRDVATPQKGDWGLDRVRNIRLWAARFSIGQSPAILIIRRVCRADSLMVQHQCQPALRRPQLKRNPIWLKEFIGSAASPTSRRLIVALSSRPRQPPSI
jgi:hypothetical protein